MNRLILIALAIFISACGTPKIENNAEFYYNRGIDRFERGDFDKAIADYNKAIEINPRFAMAYYNLGIAYRRKGHYDQAISDFTKAIEINPKLAMAHYNRGFAYAQGKGQYDQAISDYNKALEIDPRYAGAYNNLSWLLATCPNSRYRDGVEAVSLAQKAVELNKKLKRNSACMDTLAAAYAEAGNFEEAIKTQERAINLLKNSVDTKELADKKEHLESYKAHKPWREPKASGGNP